MKKRFVGKLLASLALLGTGGCAGVEKVDDLGDAPVSQCQPEWEARCVSSSRRVTGDLVVARRPQLFSARVSGMRQFAVSTLALGLSACLLQDRQYA